MRCGNKKKSWKKGRGNKKTIMILRGRPSPNSRPDVAHDPHSHLATAPASPARLLPPAPRRALSLLAP
jgi:hypothetical protein